MLNVFGFDTSGLRETLTADRTYYVRTDGSDSNNGLTDSAGGAFLTLQKAVDVVCGEIDMNAHQVTIRAGNGTYTGGVVLGNYVGLNYPIILGDTTTPSNVVISTTSDHCFYLTAPTTWEIGGFKLQTTTSGHCLFAYAGVLRFGNMDFGACAGTHMYLYGSAHFVLTGDYSITGGAVAHINATRGAVVSSYGRTITLTGTPAFSGYFADVQRTGVYYCGGCTFSGSATGVRYIIRTNGVVDTNGLTLPGNSAGSTATGGVYT